LGFSSKVSILPEFQFISPIIVLAFCLLRRFNVFVKEWLFCVVVVPWTLYYLR
jgi:hypothetical protein